MTTKGTPQGGVLSPTLWILVMDVLLKRLHTAGIKAIGYADDLTITCRGKFQNTLSEIMQRGVKIVERWSKEVGLMANPDKSETVIYTKKKHKRFRKSKYFW